MSTESGKTCGCRIVWVKQPRAPLSNTETATGFTEKQIIEFGSCHDGSMTEKLAEALKEARTEIAISNSRYWQNEGKKAAQLIRDYEASK